MGNLMRAADSEKHMARIERARGAGGAGGSAYALCIEQKQERLALDTLEAEADIAGPVSYTHLDVYKRQGQARLAV